MNTNIEIVDLLNGSDENMLKYTFKNKGVSFSLNLSDKVKVHLSHDDRYPLDVENFRSVPKKDEYKISDLRVREQTPNLRSMT